MMLFQNPIVWLRRVRQRKGYGVHSPFAFDFITGVLYNKEMYYAYSEMERGIRWWQKARVRSVRRLLFRLADFQRPETMYCRCPDNTLIEACRYGVRGLPILSLREALKEGGVDMLLLCGADEKALALLREGTMLVLLDARKCRDFWKHVKQDGRVTVTFDLYDVGIAFARSGLNKQDYVVNW